MVRRSKYLFFWTPIWLVCFLIGFLAIYLSLDGSEKVLPPNLSVKDSESPEKEPLTILTGHNKRVSSLVFSSDGQQIISGSYDGTVKIWNARSGDVIKTLIGYAHGVESVSSSPDSKRIISGGYDATLKVWDATNATELATLEVNSRSKVSAGSIYAIDFSGDGSLIAAGGGNGIIKIWNASALEELLTYTGHKSMVLSLIFSPDRKHIVSSSIDRTIKIWDSYSKKELRTIKTQSYCKCITVNSDGLQIAGGDSNLIKVWETNTGKELAILEGHRASVNALSFSPDDKKIASCSDDGTVKIWDAITGDVLQTLRHGAIGELGIQPTYTTVAFSPDGKSIATGSTDNQIKIWDVSKLMGT